jgi:hypothetical protein
MTTPHSKRAGISLLEVLISIGILAVGLTSVLSFIPAGHSMAKTSFVTDQAAIVAANALTDLVTQGFLRVDSLTNVTSPVMIDPIGAAGGVVWPLFNQAVLRQNGVFSDANAPPAPSPQRLAPSAWYLIRARDDISYNVPDSDAFDVTNRFIDGTRAYSGNFSWLATLTKPAGGVFAPGDEVTLTIVVFHSRDVGQSPLPLGAYNPAPAPPAGNVNWAASNQLVAGRKDSELIHANGVCLVSMPPAFRRISMAAIIDSGTGAFLECDGPLLAAGAAIFAVPDAVAVIEKTVTLEASSPYSE